MSDLKSKTEKNQTKWPKGNENGVETKLERKRIQNQYLIWILLPNSEFFHQNPLRFLNRRRSLLISLKKITKIWIDDD